MRTEGKVSVDGEEIGEFVVDSDDQLIVTFNENRWSAHWAFNWARDHKKTFEFKPAA